MRAKDELMRLWELDRDIDLYVDQIDRYRTKATRCISILSDMPKASEVGDKVGNIALLIVETEKKLDEMQDEYYQLTHKVEDTLAKMETQRFRNLLKYKYMDHCTWEEVAEKMDYSVRHTTKMHGWALVEYEKNMQKK